MLTQPVDLVETAEQAGGFGMLCRAWHVGGLTEILRHSGPYTVFAPNDAAFKRLPDRTYRDWIEAPDPAELLALLRYHVIPGRLDLAELGRVGELRTMLGQPLRLHAEQGRQQVGDAELLRADIAASNGLIHTVDRLLWPSA